MRYKLGEGQGDAGAKGAGPPVHATARYGDVDVVGLDGVRQPQRFGHDHAVGRRREVLVERATVDGDGAFTFTLRRAQTDAGDGLFAATGGLAEWLRQRTTPVTYEARRAPSM